MAPLGQAWALSWTLVQTVRMWPWSRNWECGRVTAARAMLASPSRATRTARNLGCWARLVLFLPPNSRVVSFGLKPSPSQSLVWNGVLTGKALNAAGLAGSAPPPLTDPAVDSGPQLV